jgi:hypothetical protein
VIRLDEDDDDTWKAIGDPNVGDLVEDKLGTGMHLSADRRVLVAMGLPGNNTGKVPVSTAHYDTRL